MADRLTWRIPEVAAALGVDDESVRRWLVAGDGDRVPVRVPGFVA